jgi:RimJ/RimL family protein N-acetyltransferase
MLMRYPDPPLRGGGVLLRRWSQSDVGEAVRCCNDEQIRRFLPAIPIPFTAANASGWIEGETARLINGSLALVIADPADRRLQGSLGIRQIEPGVAQVGYWTDPQARGRGVATAGLILISRWALRTLGAGRVQLHTALDNPASMRVAERAGFTREGVLRRWYDLRGERRDAVMFSLLPEDVDDAAA